MKVRPIRARQGAIGAAATLALAVSVTGCAGQNPTAAATVNGQVISQAEVDEIARDPAMSSVGRQISSSGILLMLMARPFLTEAARRNGTMVSTSEVRALLPPSRSNPSQQTLEFLQTTLIARKLPPRELTAVDEAFRSADITVNPRYGEFDPARGIVPATQNWLDPAVPSGQQN